MGIAAYLMMQQCTLIAIENDALEQKMFSSISMYRLKINFWHFKVSNAQTRTFTQMPSAHHDQSSVFLVQIQCKNNILVENNQNENISQHQRVMQLIEYAVRWIFILFFFFFFFLSSALHSFISPLILLIFGIRFYFWQLTETRRVPMSWVYWKW